jgi:hypothetical protein
MGQVKVNFGKIVEDSEAFSKKSEKNIANKYESSKQDFFSKFENHPVTQEIESGPEANNVSRTLNGVGNLFSYIGFDKNSDPISILKEILDKSFNFKKTKIKNGKRFTINYPTLDKIKANTPMPWESGNSWVVGIERGISGFSNYMYKKFGGGRSGQGLQSENRIRSGGFKKTKYMTDLINQFVKQISK